MKTGNKGNPEASRLPEMRGRRPLTWCLALASACAVCACGGDKEKAVEGFPAGFDRLTDAAKVEYVMNNATPDSVARFICDASLGKIAGAHIDTLAVAAAYAYENYADTCLIDFSREFDDYSSNLPLPEKMQIYLMAGLTDPQRLGYQLGLEYVDHIRTDSVRVDEVRRELEAFRKACENDTVTYTRFMKGFKTVLRLDRGRDLPEEIYRTFINY